jgi:hypothetical protein
VIFDVILLKYPGIQQVSYWHAQYDGSPWEDPYDGLRWENSEVPKPSKEDVYKWIEEYKKDLENLRVVEQRRKEYFTQECTLDKMVIALWEKLVEGRTDSVDDIQAKRVKIKQENPKT